MYSRLFRSLLPILLLFVVAGCGDDNPTVARQPEGAGSLKGRVVDSSDPSQGVAGVTVRVEGTDLTAVTDENGNYEFASVESGNRAVVVDMPSGTPYQESRVEVSVHGGEAVDMDIAVLPEQFRPEHLAIAPDDARAGVLESVQFYITFDYNGQEADPDPAGDDRPGGSNGNGNSDGGFSGAGTATHTEAGEPSFMRPTWTIRSEVPIGVISREGIFIGTAPGRGEIRATLSDEFVAVATVEVVADDDVAGIIVSPPYFEDLEEGADRYVAALARSGAGTFMDREDIAWSVVPPGIGTIEVAGDMTEEERGEILATLRPWRGLEPYLDAAPPSTDHYSIARFHAAESVAGEGALGEIRAAVGDYYEPLKVHVLPRGDLVSLDIYPQNPTLREGRPFLFFALAANQFNRAIPGLEYTWSLDPADLGVLEERELPDWNGDPNGAGGDTVYVGQGGDIDGDDPVEPPPLGDETGRPLPEGPQVRMLVPERTGEGVLSVTARDPRTGATLEATTRVVVEERPGFSRVVIEPEQVELFAGDEMEIRAIAMSNTGDVAFGTLIEWDVDAAIGVLEPLDYPHDAEYDTVLAGGDPPTNGDPGDPRPADDRGLSWRLFRAGAGEARGTIRAFAVTADGPAHVAEATVVIHRRP